MERGFERETSTEPFESAAVPGMSLFDVPHLKRSAKFAIISGGLEAASLVPAWLTPAGVAGRGLIFTLHHVRPAETHSYLPNEFLSVTPEFLDEAIATILQSGLIPVRLEELPERLSGSGSPDERYFAFTLDDGYRNNAEYAAPVFRKYGVPYTIFVTSGFSERTHAPWWETAERLIRENDRFTFDFGFGPEALTAETVDEKMGLFDRFTSFVKTLDEGVAVERINAAALLQGVDPMQLVEQLVMDEAEIRALSVGDDLVSIGAHTVSHPNLKRVSDARLAQEIEWSARSVERYTGKRPTTFAFPYGWKQAVGDREMRAIETAGFRLGVTTQPGVLCTGARSPLHGLKRVSLNGYYQKARYVRAFASGIPFRFL